MAGPRRRHGECVDRAVAVLAADRRRPPRRYERAPFAPAPDDPDMGSPPTVLPPSTGSPGSQDAYAARSHRLAVAAAEAGAFADELVAVAGVTGDDRPAPASPRPSWRGYAQPSTQLEL